MEEDQKTIWGIVFPTTDVALAQCRDQDLLNIGAQDAAIDPSPWSLGPVAFPLIGPSTTQGAVIASWRKAAMKVIPRVGPRTGGGQTLDPVAKWGFSDQALTARSPAPQRSHICLSPSLINEYKALQVNVALMFLPLCALSRHVGTVLLTGQRGFF